MFVEALRKAKVPFEIHIYEHGEHGYGLATDVPILNSWPGRCADWFQDEGIYSQVSKRVARIGRRSQAVIRSRYRNPVFEVNGWIPDNDFGNDGIEHYEIILKLPKAQLLVFSMKRR